LFVHVHGQFLLSGIHGRIALELYQAVRTTLVTPIVDNMVIDVAQTPSVNIKVAATADHLDLSLSEFSFFVNGELFHVDYSNPAWMVGDGAWYPAVGTHTIQVRCNYNDKGMKELLFETKFRVIVMSSRTVPESMLRPEMSRALSKSRCTEQNVCKQ
jgi:hypothetical protein